MVTSAAAAAVSRRLSATIGWCLATPTQIKPQIVRQGRALCIQYIKTQIRRSPTCRNKVKEYMYFSFPVFFKVDYLFKKIRITILLFYLHRYIIIMSLEHLITNQFLFMIKVIFYIRLHVLLVT